MHHARFVHLHLHTYYSLLDGAIPIDVLAAISKRDRVPAVAITDHANLFGAVEFFKKVSSEGIKPIIGAEMYILSQESRKVRDPKSDKSLCHITLLAKNRVGYRNLCRLLSSSYLEGFYYKPRIDKEILKECSQGLIALSGCIKGEIPSLILAGDEAGARASLEWYLGVFGEDFCIEIMDHGLDEEKMLISRLSDMARRSGVPIVATNDCHYATPEDKETQDVLLCIQTGRLLEEKDRLKLSGDGFHIRSPEEMAGLFKDIPEALENTVYVAERCNFEFDFGNYHFPKFSPPEGLTLVEYLTKKAEDGFRNREKTWLELYGDEWSKKREVYWKRLVDELTLVNKMGFSGYFLIVSDFIEYAKTHGIAVGPGRGSAAGSLIAYVLGITDIDPVRYNLLFERFLNPERVSMPDMDIDFCVRKRNEIINYVSNKYGNVSQIITFGKMKARAVVRDVGRVLGFSYGEVDKIAKMIPASLGITIEKALQLEPKLASLVNDDPSVARLINIARKLEGFPRHASTHAAGIVISDEPLSNFLPLYLGQNGETISQFDMKAVESIGLIKFDFLGLKTLTVIEDTLRMIKERRGVEIDIASIPLSDEAVYKLLWDGDTKGIFQLESSGMTDLIVRLKPSCFEDLIALVALFRPGPLGSGMVDDFIDRKHGRKKVEYLLPQLEDILKETYGVIVYQEQVMQIASTLAGFTLGDADLLRRAMGKKIPEEMDRQKEKFLKGTSAKKISPAIAEKIFDLMAEFAGYGFNKSHSAAYALIAYRTAYLKAHWPTEFMAALLTSEMGNTDKILEYMNDSKEHGIEILPPDVNQSDVYFTVVGDRSIRFGIAAVKNVGEAAMEAIVEARRGGAFKSLFDFCERVDLRKVNKRVLESLVKCGAMDSFGEPRHLLFANLDAAISYGSAKQDERRLGQSSLFDSFGETSYNEVTLKKSSDVPAWSEQERLAFEKESLGFYLTGHPLAEYEKLVSYYTKDNIKTLYTLKNKREVRFAAVVSSVREIMTRRGEKMAFVMLEDLTGTVEAIVFSDLYTKTSSLIKSDQPIFFIGNLEVDEEIVRVIAKDIFPIADVTTRLTDSVHFYLSAPECTKQHVLQLQSIISRYPGTCPTVLHFIIPGKSETVMSLPEKLYVKPSLDMAKTMEKVFGRNIVRFEAKNYA